MDPAALPPLFCCYIFLFSTFVESSKCPSIALSRNRSTSAPVVSNGSNYTIYQEFVTEGTVRDLNIMWGRIPSSLASSNGSFRVENQIINNSTLNASLTLWNIQPFPDEGNYTVVASNNCTSNGTYFILQVNICEPNKLPEPVIKYNIRVIPEPELPNILKLVAEFHGESNVFYAPTDWKFGDRGCLEGSLEDGHQFSCNRTVALDQCAFVANLWIPNVTYANSGKYTVQARNDDKWSNASTVDLRIIRKPMIELGSCAIEPLKNKESTEFRCRISNYSQYIEVVVVENNQTLFNKSTNEVSFSCRPNVPDPSMATCTVNVSTSLYTGKLHYKLCVGYNSSVPHKTKFQCSHDIVVSSTEGYDPKSESWKVVTFIGGPVLALLVLMALAAVIFRMFRRQKSVLTHPDSTRPLLTQRSVNEEDMERDHCETNCISHQCESVADTSCVWKTVPSGPLEKTELVEIAKTITRWPQLARHLNLSESDIVTIEENHMRDYEEQKVQMLLKWFQQQPTPPTRRNLVRIIEEQMKDSVLAQNMVNIIHTQLSEVA